ncbi:MAG TPA: helix-turn-helix transcriptional regulator [Gaiellales bacterium]|nr:helix-turn-helix transcriptional regulator [Gaiellales bacterium]
MLFDPTALRLARNAKHLSQREVAGKAGLHPTTISRLENGKEQPKLGTTQRIARPLDLRARMVTRDPMAFQAVDDGSIPFARSLLHALRNIRSGGAPCSNREESVLDHAE